MIIIYYRHYSVIILLITLFLIFNISTTVNAKYFTHHRYKVHSTYVIGSHRYPAYIFTWHDILNFKNYRSTFTARDDPYSNPVRVVKKIKIGKNIFYKIHNKANHNFNGWVYSSYLSHNRKSRRHYNFNKLIVHIMRSETDFNSNRFLKQMKRQTMIDLNHDRSRYHVAKLTENHQLNVLAQLRAKQLINDFNHYDKNGIPYTTDDASKAKLPTDFQASENIASAGLGKNTLQGDKKYYQNQNGYNMADTDNDGMMYHDQLEKNGHRQNILDPHNTLVGIGTAYNPKKQIFYLAEDFGNYNHNSSEDIKS